MNAPLVSIICLCYNHAAFLREALDSVLAQTYPNLEVLVVDDLSTDTSVGIIQEYVQQFPQIRFIRHTQNVGNCTSFNEALQLSKGEFIIDFATDDVLHPERVAQQVAAFQQLPASYGVVYTDAELIDEQSASLGFFYSRSALGRLSPLPAQGDVFADVLRRYFICPPTMMIRRQVLEELQGYDPELAYEDFDFWVRSARNWKYHFLNELTTKRRIHSGAMSKGWYQPGDRQLQSTIEVCRKALQLLRTEEEKSALLIRVKYEFKHAVFSGNFSEAEQLYALITKIGDASATEQLLAWITQKRINLSFVRRWYYKVRYAE